MTTEREAGEHPERDGKLPGPDPFLPGGEGQRGIVDAFRNAQEGQCVDSPLRVSPPVGEPDPFLTHQGGEKAANDHLPPRTNTKGDANALAW